MERSPVQLDSTVRLAVLRGCLEEGGPPSVEQLMNDLQLPRESVENSFERLDGARHIKLLPGTHRILMAFPFSAIPTPFRVIRGDGRCHFANCAWDAIAFHILLNEPIRVESFCHHCGEPVSFHIRDGQVSPGGPEEPVVYLGRPAVEWWTDIISSCSNSMLFFSSSEHLRRWRPSKSGAEGQELSIELTLRLSGPLQAGKLAPGFERPTRERVVQLFHELGLRGDFWKI